jgi:hypothetical protein
MATNKNQLYYVAAVLAGLAAILQFIDRDWFRGATAAALAGAMVLAATGFPEKSATNRRIYFVILAVVIGAMFIRLFARYR